MAGAAIVTFENVNISGQAIRATTAVWYSCSRERY